jgi:hypothetical protein
MLKERGAVLQAVIIGTVEETFIFSEKIHSPAVGDGGRANPIGSNTDCRNRWGSSDSRGRGNRILLSKSASIIGHGHNGAIQHRPTAGVEGQSKLVKTTFIQPTKEGKDLQGDTVELSRCGEA